MIYLFVTMQPYLHKWIVTSYHAHDVQWTTRSHVYVAAAGIVGGVGDVVVVHDSCPSAVNTMVCYNRRLVVMAGLIRPGYTWEGHVVAMHGK
jgi:hypothetical protein